MIEVIYTKRITEVIPGSDYLLTVQLNDNKMITIDMKKKLHTVRFAELSDQQVFKAAATDGKTVYWPSGLSLEVSEILEMGLK